MKTKTLRNILVYVNRIGSQPSRERATFRTVLPGKVFFYVRTQSIVPKCTLPPLHSYPLLKFEAIQCWPVPYAYGGWERTLHKLFFPELSAAPHFSMSGPVLIKSGPVLILSLAPYLLSLAPYLLSLAPYLLSLAPYLLSLAPYFLSLAPYLLSLAPYLLSLAPY
jgi:hypothetical protein